MSSLVDAILSGPRGRRLCLELAVGQQDGDLLPTQESLWSLLFYTRAARSKTVVRFARVSTDAGEGDDDEWPDPSTEEVAAALDAVDPIPVDRLSLIRALAASVDSARPWQDPDETDLLLAEAPMAAPLRRTAERIAGSDAARWLTEPIADEQWLVDFEVRDDLRTERPFPSAHDALRTWRNERLGSGNWWCTPPWPIPTTTRELPGLGPIGLWAVVDSFGWRGASVARASIPTTARVHEVSDAESWAELCRRYPYDLAETESEWRLSTGWEGRWVIPDWSLVAHDFDAVHVTGAAYLALAETAIPVSPDRASVIANWPPDHTYWLTDELGRTAESTRWLRPGDDGTAQADELWSPA